jgi:hypothetical protein
MKSRSGGAGRKSRTRAIGTWTRRQPRTAWQLRTERGFGPGVAGRVREARQAVGVGQGSGAAYQTEATTTSGRNCWNIGKVDEASDRGCRAAREARQAVGVGQRQSRRPDSDGPGQRGRSAMPLRRGHRHVAVLPRRVAPCGDGMLMSGPTRRGRG